MHGRTSDLHPGFGRLWDAVSHCSALFVVFAHYGADFTSSGLGSQRLQRSSCCDLCFSIREGRVVTAEQERLANTQLSIDQKRNIPLGRVVQRTYRP